MNVYTDTRDATFAELYEIALHDRNVILLTADTGAFKFKDFVRDLPRQFYNVGIAEQNAISLAAGLALAGKKVFVFGITSFVTLRCYEQIKIDVCCMNLPVTILGMGTGYGYSFDGPTHHVTQDIAIMRALPGITIWGPSDCTMTAAVVHLAYQTQGPAYIRIDKGPLRPIYDPQSPDFSQGVTNLVSGEDLTIVSTGPMVTQAYKVVEALAKNGIQAGIIDLYRLKPVNEQILVDYLRNVKKIVTLEEHALSGGLGDIVCTILADHQVFIPVKRIGIPDNYQLEVGNREYVRMLEGLDVEGITRTILNWLG
ncbi:MAG: transketolase C-terminal domain-containing protein [Chloroflexota bacterium]